MIDIFAGTHTLAFFGPNRWEIHIIFRDGKNHFQLAMILI